jgi:hypothetical protein
MIGQRQTLKLNDSVHAGASTIHPFLLESAGQRDQI